MEIADEGADVVMRVSGGGAARAFIGDQRDAAQVAGEQRVRPLFDPFGHLRVGGTARRRVVFKTAVLRWIVRGGDDNAVGHTGSSAAVVRQYGMRNDRRRRIASGAIHHDIDPVGRQHFDCADERRFRQRMGVHAEIERTGDALRSSVVADRLGNRQNVRFVEAAFEGRAAMTGRTEGNPLLAHGGVRLLSVVRRNQSGNVDQDRGRGRFARQRIQAHDRFLSGPMDISHADHSDSPGCMSTGGSRVHRSN